MERSESGKKRCRTLSLAMLGLMGGAALAYALVAWRRALMPEPTLVPWEDGVSIYEVSGEDASHEWTDAIGMEGVVGGHGAESASNPESVEVAAATDSGVGDAGADGEPRGDGAADTDGEDSLGLAGDGDEEQQTERTRRSSLIEIEGIGPTYAKTLAGLGLLTTNDLLRAGARAKGRDDIAVATGISKKLILRWVNQADLFRIRGVGEQYADLLEAAGVNTVAELAHRRADNLTRKMGEVNEQKRLVRRSPTEAQVTAWIESAKGMPRVVTY